MKERIKHAVAAIDRDMLEHAWQKLDFKTDASPCIKNEYGTNAHALHDQCMYRSFDQKWRWNSSIIRCRYVGIHSRVGLLTSCIIRNTKRTCITPPCLCNPRRIPNTDGLMDLTTSLT